jgi:hypothetical protein
VYDALVMGTTAADSDPGWLGQRHAQFLLVLATGVVILFVLAMLAATRGHFVPQVADLYVTCQYARAMAEGHPFQYNLGEAPSTGATSLLHTAILAFFHAAGARGEGLIAVAIALGALFYAATCVLAWRVACLLAGAREGLLAGALVALGGPVVWGFLYGADIALFMFLSLWLLERLLAEWHGPTIRGGALVGCLVAVARPEGLPIAIWLAAVWLLARPHPRGVGVRVMALLPLATAGAVSGLYRYLTGSWLGSSGADKSLFASYGTLDSLALASEYLVDVVRGLLFGFYPSQVPVGLARGWAPFYFPPLALLFILLAFVRPPRSLAPALRAWALMAAGLFCLVTPNVFLGVHFNRYLMWAFPPLLCLTACGFGQATRLMAPKSRALGRMLFLSGAALALALGALATLRFAVHYATMAGEVYRRDLRAAEWISANLPRGIAIANAATSVEYLTGHHNLNLHGVTSPDFFGNKKAEREAGVYEALTRLPLGRRPVYLLSSVATQEANVTLQAIVEPEPLFQTNSLSDELLIFRMRWSLVGKNLAPYLAATREATATWAEVDRLNVCDSRDEAAHRYRFESRLGDIALHGTARIADYVLPGRIETVIDSGRAILGYESFEVRAHARRPLLVVLRTADSQGANTFRAEGSRTVTLEFKEAGLKAALFDQTCGRVNFDPGSGWDEVHFQLPADLVREGRNRITLTGRYASFQYWFFQPKDGARGQ